MFAKGTAQTPEEYLSHIPQEQQEDVKTLHQMILKTLPNAKTALFGQIIGYGTYHYKSKSGREGDWFVIGLSARKKYISVYICAVENGKYIAEQYTNTLSGATIGKSCISFKKLADVDVTILKKIIQEGDALLKKHNYSISY